MFCKCYMSIQKRHCPVFIAVNFYALTVPLKLNNKFSLIYRRSLGLNKAIFLYEILVITKSVKAGFPVVRFVNHYTGGGKHFPLNFNS